MRRRASRPVTVRVSADVRVGSVAARRRPGRASWWRGLRSAGRRSTVMKLPLTAKADGCSALPHVGSSCLSRSRLLRRGAAGARPG